MVARAATSQASAAAPRVAHDAEERRLAAFVEAVAAPDRRDELVEALREDAPFYAERGPILGRADAEALRACLDALAAAPAKADCCALPLHADAIDAAPSALVRDLELEDHHGVRARFAEVFAGRPTIVVFFYTRCDN